jgi:hypothetical protein
MTGNVVDLHGHSVGSGDLTPELIARVFAESGANVSKAADALGVDTAALRRLVAESPELRAIVVEAAEKRIDKAEFILDESLDSDDPRRRDGAATFTLRSSRPARVRGWGQTVDVTVDVSERARAEWDRLRIVWGNGLIIKGEGAGKYLLADGRVVDDEPPAELLKQDDDESA